MKDDFDTILYTYMAVIYVVVILLFIIFYKFYERL